MELTIERMGAGGDGIATGPVYVPRTLPGERVRVRLLGRRGEGSAAVLEAVLTPSMHRVPPACPHFEAGCGGCALQHWSSSAQAEWKRERVREALSRAGFQDPPVAATVTTPPGRRRRADFALRRTPRGVTVGLHKSGSGDVLDLAACPVLDPRLARLLTPLRTMLGGLGALRRQGSAVVNLLDTGPDLLLRTDGPPAAADRAALAAFAGRLGIPRVAWALGDGPPEVAAQLAPATIALSGAEVAPAPGAFLQASPEGERAIIAAVLAGLPTRLPVRSRIVELHAGVGTLSLALGARGRVSAFEGEAAAVAALAAAAGRAGLPITAARRDLVRQPLMPAELTPFAAAVLDPPFAGAAGQSALLARSTIPTVIYVSCNPAALSRDARLFAAAGWRIAAATPIDQFVHSTQVEAVVVFTRARR